MSKNKKFNLGDFQQEADLEAVIHEVLVEIEAENSDCDAWDDSDDNAAEISSISVPNQFDERDTYPNRPPSPLSSSDEDDTPANASEIPISHPSCVSQDISGTASRNRRIIWKAVTSFEPLPPAPEYEEPNRSVINLPPVDYFTKYIPSNIYSEFSFFTNQTHLLKTGQPLGTTEEEMKIFFAITMSMSHLKFPRIRMYWEQKTRVEAIASRMSRDRYFKLRQWLKIVNDAEITNAEKKKTKFWKVEPLISCVRNGCRLNIPSKSVCVDEQMVPFWGKHKARQMVSGKPNPVGLKVFLLANSNGLPLDFFLYEGKGDSIIDDEETKKLDIGGKVVYRLASRLPPGCTIFMDRYFTSVDLLDLLQYSAHCTGTGTLQRRRIPFNCNFKSDAELRREGRGSYSLMVNSPGQIACFKWFDNKPVVLASNMYGGEPEDECRRWDKKQRCYVQVKRPDIVKKYNDGMGGVDYLDRMISYYRISARTRKWTIRLLFHLFDFALAASWIEYRQDQVELGIRKRDILDYLGFRDKVMDYLFFSNRDDEEHFASTSTLGIPPQKRAKQPHPSDLIRKSKVDHLPEVIPGKHRCKLPGCKSNGARHQCPTCNVVLCLVSDRNCYKLYHEL